MTPCDASADCPCRTCTEDRIAAPYAPSDWMADRIPLLRGGSRPMTWSERQREKERAGEWP